MPSGTDILVCPFPFFLRSTLSRTDIPVCPSFSALVGHTFLSVHLSFLTNFLFRRTRPSPITWRLNKSRLDRIHLYISLNSVELIFVAYRMIERLVLPETYARALQKFITFSCGVTFHRFSNGFKQLVRPKKNVNVVRHHYVRTEAVQLHLFTGVLN